MKSTGMFRCFFVFKYVFLNFLPRISQICTDVYASIFVKKKKYCEIICINP